MSRSGYSDDLDNWSMICWRGRVASATRGKRGQKLFNDLAEALDLMPTKELIAHELKSSEGQFCALGVVGATRGLNLTQIDPHDEEQVAANFDIAPCLAQEIVYMNDEYWYGITPAERWKRMREWVNEQIIKGGANEKLESQGT